MQAEQIPNGPPQDFGLLAPLPKEPPGIGDGKLPVRPVDSVGDSPFEGGQRGTVWVKPRRRCRCDRSDRRGLWSLFALRSLLRIISKYLFIGLQPCLGRTASGAKNLQVPVHGGNPRL